MVNVFDSCTDSCGWSAAVIAAIAYGSFGVPVKATKHIDVHPLVLQSYKTVMVFLSSWFVVFLGVEVAFTKWGLLSGFLWVVGGTGGIYGIRMAGLAVAVGVWASIMIMVNFIFGIVIFREPVHDVWGTLVSFSLLILGLVGMSHYSAPVNEAKGLLNGALEIENQSLYGSADEVIKEDDIQQHLSTSEPRMMDDSTETVVVEVFGIALNQRHCGILGAVLNGVFTGGSLIPLHYAKEEGFGGANYMISMSTGSFIANVLLWVCFYFYNIVTSQDSLHRARDAMPQLHFRELWLPGSIAGILLAIAMFGSIISVTYLGQAVGNSLVQTKILVSGLWGIFFYKEIRGTKTISMWFLSATIAVVAIIWLSLERLFATNNEGASGHRRLEEVFFSL